MKTSQLKCKSIRSYFEKNTSKKTQASAIKILSDTFGHSDFKSSLQKEAVLCVSEAVKDVFVCMPTGSGKSLCYQLPALMSPGLTIVFSPLLALIDDQVQSLKELGVKADSLNSQTPAASRKKILADLNNDTGQPPSLKLLYITPELAATEGFKHTLQSLYTKKRLSRIAVDEAHCVSEWGHDFRPDYLKLGTLREQFKDIPCVALTATATLTVQQDILVSLKMKQPVSIFKASCFRSNLFYDVSFKDLLTDPIKNLKDFIQQCFTSDVGTSSQGSGIIYCRTRDGCEHLAGRLSSLGMKAKPYHAGLKAKERLANQEQWMSGQVSIIVATISFGMGVDKADVRFVVHWTLPKSMEGYYQESGRAGRDGKPAFCRLYYERDDKNLLLFLLRKELQSKKSAGNKAKGAVKKLQEGIEKSFEAIVKYCEEPECRHNTIAKFFGDSVPNCDKHCDFCKEPATTKKAVQKMKSGHVPKHSHMPGTCFSYYVEGRPDPTLYGGGRWGRDNELGWEDDSDSDGEDKERNSGGGSKMPQFFSREFKKRRRKDEEAPQSVEVPGDDCKLIEPGNFSKIPKLSLKVREYCLKLLQSALSSVDSTDSPSSVEQSAIHLEYNIFQSSKRLDTYKIAVQKKVSAIKQSLLDDVVSCTTSVTEAEPPSEPQSDAGTSGFGVGFQKASDLLPVKSPVLSTDDTSAMEVTPSCSTDYSSTSDTLPPIVGFQSAASLLKCTATHKSNTSTSKSIVSTSKSNPFSSRSSIVDKTFDDQSRSRSMSPLQPAITSSPITIASSSIGITSSTVMETSTYTLSGFKPSSLLMSSMKNYHSSSTTEAATRTTSDKLSGFKPSSSLIPSRKSYHTSSPSSSSSTMGTSTDKLSGFRPASSLMFTKEAHCLSSDQQSGGHSIIQHDMTSGTKKDSPVTAASHDRHMTSSNGKCDKQKVASLVVSVLNPYLKKGKITNKDMFKQFARCVSNELIHHSTDSKSVQSLARAIVSAYFKKHGKFSCSEDLDSLNNMISFVLKNE